MQDIAKTVRHFGSSLWQWAQGLVENARDLGAANQRLALHLIADGRTKEALIRLKIARIFRPNDANLYYLTGRCQLLTADFPHAFASLKRALSLNPEHEEARFLLATSDETIAAEMLPRTYPVSLVRELFGGLASQYEEIQIGELGYQGHIALATLMKNHLPEPKEDKLVLDVGCGNGLMGPFLFSYARALKGVDVTPEMSELAFIRYDAYENSLYSDVETVDAHDYLLSPHEEDFDIIAASYAVNYMGGLSALFDGVKQSLKHGGWFVFTTDLCDGSDYRFMPTLVRFAHSPDYIRQEAHRVGLSVVAIEPVRVFEGVESIGVVCRYAP